MGCHAVATAQETSSPALALLHYISLIQCYNNSTTKEVTRFKFPLLNKYETTLFSPFTFHSKCIIIRYSQRVNEFVARSTTVNKFMNVVLLCIQRVTCTHICMKRFHQCKFSFSTQYIKINLRCKDSVTRLDYHIIHVTPQNLLELILLFDLLLFIDFRNTCIIMLL